MLIINADDLGRNPNATDAILDCHAHGRLSATSFMVFMEDSGRAARLALESQIDFGLHLNLSEEFSDPRCPAPVRAAHIRVRRFLKRSKYSLLLYHPFLRSSFRLLISAQIDEFDRLVGAPPQRLDGHQHLHLATNVLLDRLLPSGAIVRRSFSFGTGEKSAFNRSYRAWVDRQLLQRHRCTDRFYDLGPCYARCLRQHAEESQARVVEVMTHPERPAEYAFLKSDEFCEAVNGMPLDSFRKLQANPSRELVLP